LATANLNTQRQLHASAVLLLADWDHLLHCSEALLQLRAVLCQALLLSSHKCEALLYRQQLLITALQPA
jgi:hypothetical protein